MEEKSGFQEMSRQKRSSTAGEMIAFLKQNKKWWLVPILIILGGMGLLVLLSSSAAAPFIYPLF